MSMATPTSQNVTADLAKHIDQATGVAEADVDYYTSEFARSGFRGISDCPPAYRWVDG